MNAQQTIRDLFPADVVRDLDRQQARRSWDQSRRIANQAVRQSKRRSGRACTPCERAIGREAGSTAGSGSGLSRA